MMEKRETTHRSTTDGNRKREQEHQQAEQKTEEAMGSATAAQLLISRHYDASLLPNVTADSTRFGHMTPPSHNWLQSQDMGSQATALNLHRGSTDASRGVTSNFPMFGLGTGAFNLQHLPHFVAAGLNNPFLAGSSLLGQYDPSMTSASLGLTMGQQQRLLLEQAAASMDPSARGLLQSHLQSHQSSFQYHPNMMSPSVRASQQPSILPSSIGTTSTDGSASHTAAAGGAMTESQRRADLKEPPSPKRGSTDKKRKSSEVLDAAATSNNSSRRKTTPFSPPSDVNADTAATTAVSTSNAELTGRPPVVLYMPCDDAVISQYQCLARKQMELFEAQEIDVEAGAQGRNRGIVLGQVGIRCRHCAHLYPRRRTKSSTFYPSTLKSIYQTAQNMANTHLTQTCQYIRAAIREELITLSQNKKTSAGGGKEYWSDGARILGVYETESFLRFQRHSEYPGTMNSVSGGAAGGGGTL